MWEITIKCNNDHLYMLDYIHYMLNVHFHQDVVIGRYNNDVMMMSIATTDSHSESVWDYLRRLLCDVFCEKFKNEYLRDNITFLPVDSPYFEAFIQVYTYFDLELEHSIAYRLIKYMPTIYLESYFAFRMGILKNKWADLCAITNNNSSAFLSSETFLSLLKFLIGNLDPKLDSVVVSIMDKCISYIDSTTGEQVVLALNQDEMDNICTLIQLAPRRILLHYTQPNILQELIEELFDTRVQLYLD